MKAMIRMIVGRCHVSESNRQVIRYVISRLKDREQTYWAMPRRYRREFLAICIKEHEENRQLYFDVMSGNI